MSSNNIFLKYNSLDERLAIIPSYEFEELKKKRPEKKRSLFKLHWWHDKLYERKSTNEVLNGNDEQIFKNGINPEIPYKRRFGYKSKGRFAPRECSSVSYWGGNLPVTRSETTEIRHIDNPTLERVINYKTKKYSIPLGPFHILRNTPIVDLRSKDSPFLNLLLKHKVINSREEFYNDIINSKDEVVYSITQIIGDIVFKYNIGGIIYASVRAPKDFYSSDHRCLIIFKDEYMCRINNCQCGEFISTSS
jgi:hypothetical protein